MKWTQWIGSRAIWPWVREAQRCRELLRDFSASMHKKEAWYQRESLVHLREIKMLNAALRRKSAQIKRLRAHLRAYRYGGTD